MAWIESHQGLRDHPKTIRLERALHVQRTCVVGHLHVLWWWAMDYAQDGDLSRFSMDEIASACLWTGDGETFCDALISAGFLDREPLRIHDWSDYCGKLIARRQTNADRMRAARALHVPTTSVATVPNPTVPNRTQPKREGASRRPASLVEVQTYWSEAGLYGGPELAETYWTWRENHAWKWKSWKADAKNWALRESKSTTKTPTQRNFGPSTPSRFSKFKEEP